MIGLGFGILLAIGIVFLFAIVLVVFAGVQYFTLGPEDGVEFCVHVLDELRWWCEGKG